MADAEPNKRLTRSEALAKPAECRDTQRMDNDGKVTPSDSERLRDLIFQTRLKIEQLRCGGNIEQLKRAEDSLRIMQSSQRAMENQKSKRRYK
jgi:hypothetical protein